MYRFLTSLLVLLLIPSFGLAESQHLPAPIGLGQVAENLLEPVSLLSDFVSSACLVLGLSFLFAFVVKYIEHKRSPLMVPISTPVFLFILAILLLLLPLAYKLSETGSNYSLMKKAQEEQMQKK